MAAKARATSVILSTVVLAVAAMAFGQTTSRPSGSFAIEVKATARDQYAYASRIIASSPDREARNLAVIRSVAALEVIPKRWPRERTLAIRAYGEIVARLNGAGLYQNALDSSQRAIAYSGDIPQRLVFLAAKGRALMWLNHPDEAQAAFAEATTGAGFDSLNDHEKGDVLRDAGFFHERRGNYRQAAQDARTRATYCPDDLCRTETLRKALDLSLMAGDNANARTDLANLSDAALKARLRNLQPDEQELLRRIDAAILEYRKRVHG